MTDAGTFRWHELDPESGLWLGRFLVPRSEPEGRYQIRVRIELPGGAPVTYTYVDHPGWVMVVPLLDDDRVVMERIDRHTHSARPCSRVSVASGFSYSIERPPAVSRIGP